MIPTAACPRRLVVAVTRRVLGDTVSLRWTRIFERVRTTHLIRSHHHMDPVVMDEVSRHHGAIHTDSPVQRLSQRMSTLICRCTHLRRSQKVVVHDPLHTLHKSLSCLTHAHSQRALSLNLLLQIVHPPCARFLSNSGNASPITSTRTV